VALNIIREAANNANSKIHQLVREICSATHGVTGAIFLIGEYQRYLIYSEVIGRMGQSFADSQQSQFIGNFSFALFHVMYCLLQRFIKKGLLLKCARKNTQQRMFFLVSAISSS